MELNLQGQKALVTASSDGIGRAIAAALAKEGVEVIINGRSEKSVMGAIAKIKDSLTNCKFDDKSLYCCLFLRSRSNFNWIVSVFNVIYE